MTPHSQTTVAPPPLSTEPGELFVTEMAADWRRGECRPTEYYLDQHPELLDPPEGAIRLVYEEVCLRQERGEDVTADELNRRFPEWAGELSVLLDCDRLMRSRLAPPEFPKAGETLGDFRLVAELGRGTHGRVFLATQPTLADRPVVLKVTPRHDREFLSLARLQHTHIIPLHGVHDFPTRNLRALCQPYFGGTTFARLLDLLEPLPVAQRTGRSLVDALDRARGASPLPPSHRGPRAVLARMGYAEAIAWIGACLADALHYAHERDLLHLDLKPSNVLLAADGQPLLLDFHLALHPLAAGRPAPDGVGGTLETMSPEQRAAYAAANRDEPVPIAVDGRSDVYSLGRLLYSALGGEATGDTLSRLSRCNPRVSVGLSDIVHRCLETDPANRYSDAAALASDLRRHLADLPLRGVPNRNVRERWHKWRRRRPYSLVGAGMVLALTAGAVALATSAIDRVADARMALRDGQELMQRHSFAEAERTLARGRARMDGMPGNQSLAIQLDDWLGRAQRAGAVERLHAICERARLLAGAEVLPAHDLRDLDAHCRAAWETRTLVADRAHAPLDGIAEEQARTDLIDLALLWTDLRRKFAAGNAAMQTEARAVLTEVDALCGPSAAVARELRFLDGRPMEVNEPSARPFWESVALGRSFLRSGELDRAAAELERAVDLRPQDFWAHFYRGVCGSRRGRQADAIAEFGTAVALAPECPEVYYNRALAYAAIGNNAAARHDYNRVLTLAPTLAVAALNRGVLSYQEGHYPEALADLGRALEHGADPATVHYDLALVQNALKNPIAARNELDQVLQVCPSHADALALRDRLGPPD